MNKTLTNLLRSAFVVCCIICTATFAKAEVFTSVNAGGTTDDYSCTIGEAIASANAGLLAVASDLFTGIDGIYADGGVIVGNVAAKRVLNLQLTDAMVADGAYYNVYNLQGMLLESNRISSTTYVLNYAHLLRSNQIIVTVNTRKGVVATYKLSK